MFKQFIIAAILLAHCMLTQAQQNHFIYIQSEDKQPFYVVLNGKQYNSTITGYGIIPKLTQGQYNVEVNAVKNRTVTRVNFTCSIHERDMGYLLKSIEGKGFTLIDLQTQQVVEPTQTISDGKTAYTTNFGEMLADVTNDPSLKNKNNIPVFNTAPSNNNIPVSVVKIDENNTSQTTLYTYVDVQKNGKVDTIRISIAKNKTDTNAMAAKTIIKKDTLIIMDTIKITTTLSTKDSAISTPTAVGSNNIPTTQSNTIKPVYNPNCRALAGVEEVEKLKRSFVQQASEEDMILLAKRQFEKKCFTTAQIQSLGRLFLSDATRFQFFKAAYPYIYDIDQASSLQQQLADTYYISLFQSLLKK